MGCWNVTLQFLKKESLPLLKGNLKFCSSDCDTKFPEGLRQV